MYRWSQNCRGSLSVLIFLFNAFMLKGIVEDLTFHCSACKFTQPKLSYIIKGLSRPLVIKKIAPFMGAFWLQMNLVYTCLPTNLNKLCVASSLPCEQMGGGGGGRKNVQLPCHHCRCRGSQISRRHRNDNTCLAVRRPDL